MSLARLVVRLVAAACLGVLATAPFILPQFEAEFRRRGVTSVLTKPFDLNDLLDRVRELCPV